jgi:ubiquinone/menaquinone biosynthesis C-methylase UbiE
MDRSFFWEKMAERYSRQPIADEASYQKKLQLTRDYFRPDMQLLELGCGTGSTAIVHSPYVKHIRAIDISSKMIEIAKDKAAAENIRNISFERSTIDIIDIAEQSIDAVLALSILHLLENKEAVIQRIHKMLKPGGFFISSTACIGDSMKLFKLVAPIGRIFGLVLKVFTRQELRDSLTNARFELDYEWQPPGKGKSVFIVARKPDSI